MWVTFATPKPLRRECQKLFLCRENTLCKRGTCCRADKNFCKTKTWRQAKHIKPCYMCKVLITEDNTWVWQKHLYGTGQLGPSTSRSLWLWLQEDQLPRNPDTENVRRVNKRTNRNKNTAAATELRVQISPCFCLHSKTKLMRLTVQQGCEHHVSVSKLCTQADVIKPDLIKPKWISSADAVHEGHWQSLSDRARRLILCDGPARLTVGKHIALPSFKPCGYSEAISGLSFWSTFPHTTHFTSPYTHWISFSTSK